MNELANDEEATLEARDLEERIFKRISLRVRDENAKMLRSITSINASNTWFRLGNDGGIATNGPSDDDPPSAIFQLSKDVYAILATASWRSFPFWFSLIVIFGFQYLLVILLLVNTLGAQDSDNPLNLPPNVEPSVRTSQMMLIVIALFSQGDLLSGIELLVRGLPDHFRGDNRFASMTRLQWRLSSIVRFTQGLLNLLACFVLAIQSETVSDVLLNVLGVAFISDLDELAFRLCLKGYFGGSMKVMSNDLSAVQFHRTTPNIRASVPMITRKTKKDGHIISAMAVLLLAIVAFGYFAIEQYSGAYLKQNIRIEFGDEVLPFLGLFNGCYQTSESSYHIDGRLVYEQVGYRDGGKFAFCSDFEDEGNAGWVFFVRETPDDTWEDEMCKKENYILRSGETETFSLLEAGKTKWYTNDDLPMDYLEITETKSSTTECGQSMFEDSKDNCPAIVAFDTMNMTKLSPPANVDKKNGLDAAVSHPIYFSQNSGNENGGFGLAFFTGRRWIITKSDHIIGLGNEPSVDNIESFFFSNNGLFKIIDQLRTPVDEEVEWVSAVSEIVDTTRDQGSPLGLLWYFPRYAKETDHATEMGNLIRNFPSANLARPIDSVWTCDFCNNDTNPCLHDGICDAKKGTCADCKHDTSGKLCQVLPLGNGICNLFFNTPEYNYDGGDCCAGTCEGVDCGKGDLANPFSLTQDELDELYRGREYAFGVAITDVLYTSSGLYSVLHFRHCIDPNTALLTIRLQPSEGWGDEVNVASTTVQCDGTLYLQTQSFSAGHRPNHTYEEEVRVPYGAQCEFRFNTNVFPEGYLGEISMFAENRSVPFLQHTLQQESSNDVGETTISLGIPKSQCIWDVFVEHLVPPELTEVEQAEFFKGVDVDSLCDDDRQGEVLDQYAVWKIIKPIFLLGADFDYSELVEGPVCSSGFLKDQMRILDCQNNRVSFLGISGMLKDVPATVSDGGLRSMPNEILRLSSLTSLDLFDNQLEWIPSELGLLTSLSYLDLGGNQLERIPSEIGNLRSLTSLSLYNNPMTWYSVPSEVKDLELGGELVIDICRPDGVIFLGDVYSCLDFTCNNDASLEYADISGTIYDCGMYNSSNHCLRGDIWGGDYVNPNVDPDVSGRNACCICGGGTYEFTSIWPYYDYDGDS